MGFPQKPEHILAKSVGESKSPTLFGLCIIFKLFDYINKTFCIFFNK